MLCLRNIDTDLRRARLLGARRFGVASIPRRAILRGEWDGGTAVSQFRNGRGTFARTVSAEASNADKK